MGQGESRMIQNKKYSNFKEISSGTFGKVYKAKCEGKSYAIKEFVFDSQSKLMPFISELVFIQKISGKFDEENENFPIINIFGYECINTTLYYVMEFGDESLENFCVNLKNKDDQDRINHIWNIYSYILKALLFLESIEVVHRDIKPANFIIFYDKTNKWGYNIKLIDFNTIRSLDGKSLTNTTCAGTLAFMAPESFKDEVYKNSDIWSLGIILFYMIFKCEFPEYVEDHQKILTFALSKKDVNFPNYSNLFTSIVDIAKKCLVKEYRERMCASELYKYTRTINHEDNFDLIIPHSFFRKTQTDEFVNGFKKRIYKLENTLNGHNDWVTCLQVINSNTLASGSSDKTIKIWNLRNKSCVQTLYGHTNSINCLQLINENILISGSMDKNIKIWNIHNNKCIQTLNGHTEAVLCLKLIDENTLASGSMDKSIMIWNLLNYSCVLKLNGHENSVKCLQLINGNTLASGSWDKTIKIWNFQNTNSTQTLKGHTCWVICMRVINENTLASGSSDKTIKIWNLLNYTCVHTLTGHSDWVKCLQLFNENTLASGSSDKTIKIWNLQNYTCVQTLDGHTDKVKCLQLIDEKSFASCSKDFTIKIWKQN